VNVVVGDVSGKGIPAAILSSMLDGLCYGLGAQGGVEFDLGKVAGDVNRYLVGKSGFERFVSVFFGTLGTDGRLLYVNAGHNPPLRVTASGKVDLLRTGGMIMGMFEEAEFQTGELRVEPGDMLVLYSDGLTDSRSKAGERFGLDRLKEAAIRERRRGARGAHDAILAAVQAFTGGAPLVDDLTLLMLRKK
jgi:sigma-B regulation protein RsbU (phosphoserine phosphatase)